MSLFTGQASAPAPNGLRLVAIVATHDRPGHLRRTVRALLQSPPAELAALVVVDNASRDDTRAWLSCVPDPRLHVLRLERNMGGAGGFAAGLEHARRTLDPDWYLLMDDDARPAPGALGAFHDSDLKGWDAIAGAAYLPRGGICDTNRPSRDPFASWRQFLCTVRHGREGFHLGPVDYAGARVVAVDAASFVGLFLSRRALDLAGLPDRNLFIYCDDTLQTLRLSRAGGRIGFNPALHFEHDTELPGAESASMPLWKLYYKHRNSLILYREAAGWLFWPACVVVLARWLAAARGHRGQRRAYLGLLARAVLHGLRGRTAFSHEQVLDWARMTPATPAREPEGQDTDTDCSVLNSVPSSCLQMKANAPGAATRT